MSFDKQELIQIKYAMYAWHAQLKTELGLEHALTEQCAVVIDKLIEHQAK